MEWLLIVRRKGKKPPLLFVANETLLPFWPLKRRYSG
jgi:hypothetical protein